MWFCFFVFNITRLAFGMYHHLYAGPLAPKKLRALVAEEERLAAEARGLGGGAVQVEPVKPKFQPLETRRSKLQYDNCFYVLLSISTCAATARCRRWGGGRGRCG